MSFWDAIGDLTNLQLILFLIALVIAFGFEFINGFHDTANAVTTVIYTHTMKPTPAVLYSGFMNFLGVLVGGTAVAFGIVNLLPVDLLVEANSSTALVMVLSLLLAGVIWNLGTWYLGIPVSSSHTLIGCVIGVGLANSLIKGNGLAGLQWDQVAKVGLALLISPLIGFLCSFALLRIMRRVVTEPRLYTPPQGDDRPPGWVRGVLIATCGGVSFAHGSNDGQKGMGLLLLVLIGFLSAHYALDTEAPEEAVVVLQALPDAKVFLADRVTQKEQLAKAFEYLEANLANKQTFRDVPKDQRWDTRQAIFTIQQELKTKKADKALLGKFSGAIEFVPLWVKIGVALALGIGTTIGYKRIVITVAEKIGKTHLTYAQGAAAESVAAVTILAADLASAPVSTTQVLSSGIAGTMAANGSGVQGSTCKKILLAWLLTFPSTLLLSGGLFVIGRLFVK